MSFDVRRPFARLAAAACLVISALALAGCANFDLSAITIPGLSRPSQAAPAAPRPIPPVPPQPRGLPLVPPPGTEVLPPTPGNGAVPPQEFAPPAPSAAAAGKVPVAILLPLTGPTGPLGQAMLNAAQMAVYDLANDQLELVSRDTRGTPDGAADAAKAAVAAGAQIILGPLLAAEVETVKPIAAAAGIPVIAFSTATQLAGQGVYLFGFVPGEETARVVNYAHAQGHTRFALLAPNTAYGQIVAAAVRSAVAADGATLVRAEFYDPAQNDLSSAVRSFAAEGIDYDALFLPESGLRMKSLAPLLPYFKIDPDQVKFLGTGLWDEPGLGSEPALDNAWYAAPPPSSRAAFETRYKTSFGAAPPRLATLGYDAMALAAVLARGAQGPDFSPAALTSPNGFAGLDGIFRLRSNGLVQRGLAILAIQNGPPTVVDPPPQTFQDLGE